MPLRITNECPLCMLESHQYSMGCDGCDTRRLINEFAQMVVADTNRRFEEERVKFYNEVLADSRPEKNFEIT